MFMRVRSRDVALPFAVVPVLSFLVGSVVTELPVFVLAVAAAAALAGGPLSSSSDAAARAWSCVFFGGIVRTVPGHTGTGAQGLTGHTLHLSPRDFKSVERDFDPTDPQERTQGHARATSGGATR